MKRTILISLVIIALCLIAAIVFLNKSDYHGKIGDLKEDNFLLIPLKIDPEAQYNTTQIYFDDKTNVVGVNKVEDLKDGLEVKVWVKESEGKRIADTIKFIIKRKIK